MGGKTSEMVVRGLDRSRVVNGIGNEAGLQKEISVAAPQVAVAHRTKGKPPHGRVLIPRPRDISIANHLGPNDGAGGFCFQPFAEELVPLIAGKEEAAAFENVGRGLVLTADKCQPGGTQVRRTRAGASGTGFSRTSLPSASG